MNRAPRQVERFTFRADEVTHLCLLMSRLAAAGDGWVNLMRHRAEEEQQTSLRFGTLFGGGNPGMTMATWIPARRYPRGTRPPSLGIAHVAGTAAVARLTSAGLSLPEGWFVEQDHRRRGLVVRLPPDEPNESVVAWALKALSELSPASPTITWRAEVHLPAAA